LSEATEAKRNLISDLPFWIKGVLAILTSVGLVIGGNSAPPIIPPSEERVEYHRDRADRALEKRTDYIERRLDYQERMLESINRKLDKIIDNQVRAAPSLLKEKERSPPLVGQGLIDEQKKQGG
jgi:hypothetical protein